MQSTSRRSRLVHIILGVFWIESWQVKIGTQQLDFLDNISRILSCGCGCGCGCGCLMSGPGSFFAMCPKGALVGVSCGLCDLSIILT